MQSTRSASSLLRPLGVAVLTSAGLLLLLAAGCRKNPNAEPATAVATINPQLHPGRAEILAKGISLPVAASRDEAGIQSDFVAGVILLRPRDDTELRNFLARYGGTILRDDTIAAPPAELGVTLTDEERKPQRFVIRIDLAKSNVAQLAENAAKADFRGKLEFSSEAGLQTFAGIFDARVAGFRVAADYIDYGQQAFPITLFRTEERQTSPGLPGPPPTPPTFLDPLANPPVAGFGDFGPAGNQANVLLAWQFIAAHGIQRRVRVAIIDSGFYLDAAGMALGTDSDFPPPPQRAAQWDIDFEDGNAGDPGPGRCGGGNCWWHGTGCASVATGIANNRLGTIGTGGQVADPILLRVNGTRSQRNLAIRTAIAWGADVVSMSFGGDCNTSCRIDDRDNNPFDDAVNSGSRVVFVAAAGNGAGTPAAGYDVGCRAQGPGCFHPCIEDHVICVGALNPGTNGKIGYSNFGAQVQLFAPTNIPIMSTPPGGGSLAQANGPAAPQIFRGTSASTPFVAGVAAMMKAVDPNLNHHQVAQILRETARPGAAPQVTRTLDAYAAVSRVAQNIRIVPDTGEPNDLNPTNLGSFASYNQRDLNIDTLDRDYYQFDSPGGSVMTLNLPYPQGLGALSVFSLETVAGACGAPVLVNETPLAGGGKTITYQISGGAMKLGLRADGVNAYNLNIAFAAGSYPPDSYEPNDTPATARRLRSFAGGPFPAVALESRITIDATLHAATDVDHYIVQGAKLSGPEQVLLVGFPAIRVYGNDSRLRLEVFRLNPDGTPGPQVATEDAGSCMPAALSVRLDSDVPYLVKVSGSPGRYTLRNGVEGDRRRIPVLVRDRIYEVLHPGEPIEHELRFPELYVFAGDRMVRALRSAGPELHLRLLDMEGNVVAEGDATPNGEVLGLANTSPEQVYALEINPRENGARTPRLNLEWDLVR